MNEFERAIAAEQANLYKVEDQDQFVFDTLTAIQAQKSNTLKWVLIVLGSVMLSLVVVLQFFFFQAASFDSVSRLIQNYLVQNPHYFALFNLGVIAVVLAIRKFRFN